MIPVSVDGVAGAQSRCVILRLDYETRGGVGCAAPSRRV